MLKVIFTLDYEIHGNGEGFPYELMVDPTHRMMALLDRYGAKLTIMADVAEILKFRQYKEQFGCDDYQYTAIVEQLCEAIRRGHDVQLHLHPSYFNARYYNGRWLQDWSEYNCAALPSERLNEIVRIGKQYLEGLLKPIDPKYECIAFRAANWAMNPSVKVVRALLDNGIRIDSSVFKYGRREGIVNFNYSNAYSELLPWPVDENNICRRDDSGRLIEMPIYSERRWIGMFLTFGRVNRLLMSHDYPICSECERDHETASAGLKLAKKIMKGLSLAVRTHAWKADFNQCSSRQLARAITRAAQKYEDEDISIPFVLIGHSKLFKQTNERSLVPFLDHIVRSPHNFQFGTFRSVDCANFEGAVQGTV